MRPSAAAPHTIRVRERAKGEACGRKKTWAEPWKLHNALVLFSPAP